jgi:hypothetical protein
MSTFDKAHGALDKLSTAIHALDSIEAIVKSVSGDNAATDAIEVLHIVELIIDAVRSGFEDHITVGDVEDEIKALRQTVLDNDTEADQALRDRFKT